MNSVSLYILSVWAIGMGVTVVRMEICRRRYMRPAKRRFDEAEKKGLAAVILMRAATDADERRECGLEADAAVEQMRGAAADYQKAGIAAFHPIQWYRQTGKFF